jgi:hypothetical protein
MTASHTTLGPGTVKVGGDAGGVSFECEVIGATITHEYADSDKRTMLCGDVRGGAAARSDGFTADLENDLSAAGLYAYLIAHDLEVQPFTFTPNTADGATWAGKVTLTLPDEVGADEFGAPLAGKITWAAADTGRFTFTPTKAAAQGVSA